MPRFYCPAPLTHGQVLSLPAGAARHVQVLRLQPGDVITLFNGEGGEFNATVTRMGRSDVEVEVGSHHAVEREAARAVHLLVGITSITPLVAERSVLKLKGERADKKLAHWQGVAVAAAEQCGRNRVPPVHPAVTLNEWLKKAPPGERWMLSLSDDTQALSQRPLKLAVTVLSGPEGGLSPNEEAAAKAAGFTPVSLGPRVLRAETAPLAVLAACA